MSLCPDMRSKTTLSSALKIVPLLMLTARAQAQDYPADPFAPPPGPAYRPADPFKSDPLGDLAKQKDMLAAASAVVKKMPEGADKDALAALVHAYATVMKERIHALQHDLLITPFSVAGPQCELKKAQVEEILKTDAALPSDHIPLRDGRKVSVSSITLLTPSSLRWIGDRLEEASWSEIDPRHIHLFGWTEERQRRYEEWRRDAVAKAVADRAKAVAEANRANLEAAKAAETPMALRGDIAAAIDAFARKEYPTDFSMQEYVREKQRAAVDKIRGYLATGAVGVPKDVMAGIIQRAAQKWETDYRMIVYEIEREVKSYRR